MKAGPVTKVAQNVAEIIREHVLPEVERIDRMYLNAYVPSLQTEGGFVRFVRGHPGFLIVSTAVVAPMSEQFVRSIKRFARDQQVDVIAFAKGQHKDDMAKDYLTRCGAFTQNTLIPHSDTNSKRRTGSRS